MTDNQPTLRFIVIKITYHWGECSIDRITINSFDDILDALEHLVGYEGDMIIDTQTGKVLREDDQPVVELCNTFKWYIQRNWRIK